MFIITTEHFNPNDMQNFLKKEKRALKEKLEGPASVALGLWLQIRVPGLQLKIMTATKIKFQNKSISHSFNPIFHQETHVISLIKICKKILFKKVNPATNNSRVFPYSRVRKNS